MIVVRKDATAAAVLFLLALATRLILLAQLLDEPLFRSPQLDGLEYLRWARQIASGDLSWPVNPIHGPGYPFFAAAILAATGSLTALHLAQAVVGAVTSLLVFLLARRHFGLLTAIAAGVLHALCGPLLLLEMSVIAEGLLIFLLCAALLAERRPLLCGLLLGLAIIVRPTAAVLLPVLLWRLWRDDRRRAAVFMVAVALPVVPVVALNAVKSGTAAVQTAGGVNVYIGNSPLHDGTAWARPGGEWDLMRGMAWRAGVRGAAAEDRFYVRQTLREIGEHPLRFLRVLLLKLVWLTQNEELRDTHSFHFFVDSSSLLKVLPRYGIVFALAVIGIVVSLRRGASAPLLLASTILIAATVVFLVAGSRYRAPLIPLLCIYAGAAVAWAAERAARREFRALATAAVSFAVLLAGTRIHQHAASHEVSEEMAMTALTLKNEENADGAVRAAQAAVMMNPQRSAAWVALGDVELWRGNWDTAERAWRKAAEVDPNNARAWSHIALAHIRRGEKESAERALRRSLSINASSEALRNLALLRRSR
jgi:hypothetical protein